MHDLVDGFRQLFQSQTTPSLAQPLQHSVGMELFHYWLAPFWEKVKTIQSEHPTIRLTLLCDVPEILMLPWELLKLPDGGAIALNNRVILRRHSDKDISSAIQRCITLSPGPLRVLFVISSPIDSQFGDYYDEMAGFYRAIATLSETVIHRVSQSACVTHIQQEIYQFQPHIVLMNGPMLIRGEQGFFGFEEPDGQADILSSSEIYKTLFKNSGVGLVILTGRECGKPPPVAATHVLCQALVSYQVDLALAWPIQLSESFSISFLHALFQMLAEGDTLDLSIRRARQSIFKQCEQAAYPAWALPVLYARSNRNLLYNTSPMAIRMQSTPSIPQLFPLPGLSRGHAQPYHIQHRHLQKLLPSLKSGELKALLMSGTKDSGKTLLATSLAHKLKAEGFTILALAATSFQPLSAGRLLASFESVFQTLNLKDEWEIVNNSSIGMEERLGFVAAVLNQRWKFVLVLDGLEGSLNEKNGHFLEPNLGIFIAYLMHQKNSVSRVLITSRIVPHMHAPSPLPTTYQQYVLPPYQKLPDPQTPNPKLFLESLEKSIVQVIIHMTVFNFPVDLVGFSSVTGYDRDPMLDLLYTMQREGLAFSLSEGEETLWQLHISLITHIQNLDLQQKDLKNLKAAHYVAGIYLLERAQDKKKSTSSLSWLELSLEGVGHLLQSGEYEQALKHAEPVNGRLFQNRLFAEQLWLNQRFLAIQEHPQPLYLLASALLHLNRLEEAEDILQKVITLTETNPTRETSLALFDSALLEKAKNPDSSKKKLEKALMINRNNGDPTGEAVCLSHLGFLAIEQGDSQTAQHLLDSALTLCRRLNDTTGIANLLPWIADLLFRGGNLDQARSHFQEAIPLLKVLGDSSIVAQCYHQLATMDLNSGDLDLALTGFQTALQIKQQLEDQEGEAATFFQLGRLAKEKGNQEACLRLLGLCYRIDQTIGNSDADQELTMFREIADVMGLDEPASQTILEEVWTEYQKDRGVSFISKTFHKT